MPSSPSDSKSSSLTELSGTILERRYELGQVLGAGGMGAVFEARHLRLDRPVAIKVLRPVFVGHDEYIKRFLREAKSASKIRHRNVVEILDYGEAEGGLVYSVMEFLVGEDLEQRLRREPDGRLPWSRLCGLLIQIASGLKAAHAQGVIHRDIKPANCYLTEEEGEPLVKLVDFGIAKVQDADQTNQLTDTAQVLGTPTYIAPELVRTKQSASARSDIYSLGVLAYRSLAGRVPFRGDTVFDLLHKACFEPVPPLRELAPEVPEAVEAFVMQMLAKDPTRRPADMLAVRQRLQALGRQTGEARAVDISVSKELPLAEDGAPRGATDRTTRPRRAAVAKANGEDATRRDLPTNQLEGARRKASAEPAPPPAETPVVATERAPVPVMPPHGAPALPVHDPTSTPSRSGETVPAFGENTLRMGDSGAVDRPRARGAVWGAIAGVLLLAGAGATVATGLLRDEEGTIAAVERAEPATAKPDSPEASPDEAKADASGEGPAGAAADEPIEAGVEGSGSSSSEGGEEPATAPEPRRGQASKSSGPPPDWRVKRELKRRISKSCKDELAGGGVSVHFMVRSSGEVASPTASPMSAAGRCAIEQVRGAEFRPRATSKNFEISVE